MGLSKSIGNTIQKTLEKNKFRLFGRNNHAYELTFHPHIVEDHTIILPL